MARIWTDILVPLAIAGAVAAQTVGVEVSRTSRMHPYFPGALRDTVETVLDTVKTAIAAADTLYEDEDFFFGEETAQVDTTPEIFARDTMKVPDSLKLTDPFRYRWYVAIKDSLTHRIVVDSLKAVSLQNDVAYWDLYRMMGGANSMSQWVRHKPAYAGGDYIHFTSAGAQVVGETFARSLLTYYDFYDLRKTLPAAAVEQHMGK